MDLPGNPVLRRAESASGDSTSTTSLASHPSRNLLFGEIDSNSSVASGPSCQSNNSVCNLVLSFNQPFLRFWLSEDCRETFLSYVDRKSMHNVRQVCHDFAARAAPHLFRELSVTFKPTSFTKSRRMLALKKIGHHATKLTFRMPHSSATLLPPLLDPDTGEQINFTYFPRVDRPSTPKEGPAPAKYGSEEMTSLLIEQYPPLFHAATNVPAFIKALSYLKNLEHLRISCPGQDEPQIHRRSVVDYALISLRIAIERAPLEKLDALTLDSIHPAALFYLQPVLGIGSSPGSQRRWSNIQKICIHMTAFPFNDPERTEHLRILHAYLRTFSPNLTKLHFTWEGGPCGPSPLSLDREPILQQSSSASSLKGLRFPKLQYMALQNAVMDSSQVASFVRRHAKSLVEFTFEDVTLRSGDWDHALKPLRKSRNGRSSSRRPTAAPSTAGTAESIFSKRYTSPESMDVPCVWSPIDHDEPRIMGTLEPQGGYFATSSPSAGHRIAFRMGQLLGSGSKQPRLSHNDDDDRDRSGSGGTGTGTGGPRKLVKKDKRESNGAGHLKRVWKSSVFSWR